MAFKRSKRINGELYWYLVESYRDPETGKVRQRHLAYLGKNPNALEEGGVAPISEIGVLADPTIEVIRKVPTIGEWVEFKPEHGIGGRWQVMSLGRAGNMVCRAEFSPLNTPGFWVGHVARVLEGYIPLGTTVSYGAIVGEVVQCTTNGENGEVWYENPRVVCIKHELGTTQVPRDCVLVN